MENRKRRPGLAMVVALAIVNLLLVGLTVQDVRAGGGGGYCDEPNGDDPCNCFGWQGCVADWQGDSCVAGWSDLPEPECGRMLEDPIYVWDPVLEQAEWTCETCETAN